ncbi:MAG: hypothetical protein ABI766_02555 [Gemmatimonadales bacterium]
MLEQKKNAAFGMMLGVLLLGGTAAQASAQATQDTSKAPSQDTSAYSAPQAADTGAPGAMTDTAAVTDTSAMKAGTDTTGMSRMGNDSSWTDTSKAAKKAWKKKHHTTEDSTSAK